MATLRVCDFCRNTPRDLEAESGGDVRHVTLTIGERIEGRLARYLNSDDAKHDFNFDMCHACRLRYLSGITENIPGTVEDAYALPLTPEKWKQRCADMLAGVSLEGRA